MPQECKPRSVSPNLDQVNNCEIFGHLTQGRLPNWAPHTSQPPTNNNGESQPVGRPRFRGRIAAQRGPGTFQGLLGPLTSSCGTPTHAVAIPYNQGAVHMSSRYGINQYLQLDSPPWERKGKNEDEANASAPWAQSASLWACGR